MKKKIFYLACLVLLAVGATSCQKLSECKNCKKVYYINVSTYDHEDPESQYCGTELIAIESTGPVTIGAYTVKWECH
jgi:hypothetical protein